MKKIIFLTITALAFLASNELLAKDYGVHGATFDIKEESFLEFIMKKINKAVESGELERKLKEKAKELVQKVQNPPAVEGITKTQEERISYYDPSFFVEKDIKDHRGNILHSKGSVVNPLDVVSWGDPLIFLDGDDPIHQSYALKSKNEKIILVKGKPVELEEKIQKLVYFDQLGTLTKKFGIKYVPCRVSQDCKRLKVHEFKINVNN